MFSEEFFHSEHGVSSGGITSRCTLSPRCSSDAVRPTAAGGAGHIACQVIPRFWRFTIEQPHRLILSLSDFRACLLAGRR
ncbi:hypothetical protein EMIT0P291_250034 [Pseudomonas sp. IT-P291]